MKSIFNVVINFFKFIYYFMLTLPRDLKGLISVTKIKQKSKLYDNKNYAVHHIFEKWVKLQPKKACIIYNENVWTFEDIEVYSNKIANLFKDKYDLKKGDCVALFMENRPEFACIWIGLGKIGVITALINTNLRLKTLIHSIEIAKPKLVIYDSELEQAISQVHEEIKHNLIRFGQNKERLLENVPQLEKMVNEYPDLFTPNYQVNGTDILMYIYTSGTTGLPKPAIIKHNRYVAGGFSFFDAAHLTKDDVVYVTLPIYHSNACIIGLGSAIISGASVVLRKKFSATNFWKDAFKHNCTAFTYVGEICRYLLNQPVSDFDKMHKIKVCIGNGTREYISKSFHSRFGVKCVEIYGATEGNCVLINTEGKYGACGFIPLINSFIEILPYYIIRVDEGMNPIRDKNGYCIKCKPGEKGLLVGIIENSTKSDYSGYANNSEASKKKIIENLFKENQRAFNSGDILVSDCSGYVYFVDRLGDTFRWRGENVSTLEVEDVFSSFLNSVEVSCYGVEVPYQEGKAGMISIVTESDIDVEKLREHVEIELPSYAKPLFIRLTKNIEHTGSLKAIKSKLVQEAYNINVYNDKTFYFETKEKNYKLMTKEIYENIQKGLIKF